MKKIFVALLTALTAVCLAVFGAFAFAAETPAFKTTDGSIEVTTGTTGIVTATGLKESEMVFKYSEKVNFTGENGASFRFVYLNGDIGKDARKDGNNYVEVTVLNAAGVGVRLKIYMLYNSTNTAVHKSDVDVFYVNPTIKKSEHATDYTYAEGEKYQETIELYENVEGTYHTVDIHKESGLWYIAYDGLASLPVVAFKDMDLSSCDVTFKMYSKVTAPQVKLYPVQSVPSYDKQNFLKKYIVEDFMQLGSDIISYNNDDTVKIKVADKRAAQFPGAEIRYREQLISTIGYDVRKPINLEYSYDVSNASAVWYAFGLGRGNVLDTISTLKYDVYGADKSVGKSNYSDSLASKNDGIMLQTTTGLAQPTYQPQNGRKEPYKTNSASKPYSGRGNIDLVTFIVGETGTSMYMNGDLIFDGLITKLSDFANNNYLCYPYFHFFEDVGNTSKGNTIVIKGINAALRTDDTDLKVVGNSNADLEVGLDNVGNGDIALYDYQNGVFTALDSNLYSYDAASKKLTVKYAYFDGKAYDVYKLYARNNSGSEEIVVRLSDPSLSTLPATTDKAEYDFIKGSTQDIVVKVDIHNGTWSSFSGGGITSSQWIYVAGENGSTIGTITIKASYLNGKKAGPFTFTIRTTNVEEETFSSTFKINVKNKDQTDTSDTSSSGSTDTGSSSTTGGNSTSNNDKKGCGAKVVSLAGAISLAFAAAIVIGKRK